MSLGLKTKPLEHCIIASLCPNAQFINLEQEPGNGNIPDLLHICGFRFVVLVVVEVVVVVVVVVVVGMVVVYVVMVVAVQVVIVVVN